MELGHLLTRSGLTYPEVSSKVYHDSFCQLGSSISLPWIIYFEARVVSSCSCIPVICPKLVLFLASLQLYIFKWYLYYWGLKLLKGCLKFVYRRLNFVRETGILHVMKWRRVLNGNLLSTRITFIRGGSACILPQLRNEI